MPSARTTKIGAIALGIVGVVTAGILAGVQPDSIFLRKGDIVVDTSSNQRPCQFFGTGASICFQQSRFTQLDSGNRFYASVKNPTSSGSLVSGQNLSISMGSGSVVDQVAVECGNKRDSQIIDLVYSRNGTASGAGVAIRDNITIGTGTHLRLTLSGSTTQTLWNKDEWLVAVGSGAAYKAQGDCALKVWSHMKFGSR